MHKIFIIEDSEVDFTVLERAFADIDFKGEIIHFKSGKAAIEHLQGLVQERNLQSLPSLILSDINMPGYNGFDFCKFIMGNEHLVSIPTILISNSNNPEDIKQAYQSGARTLLNKRIEYSDQVNDLKALINFWLEGVAQIRNW